MGVGERLGSSGESIIEACVTGYEVVARIASAIRPSYARYQKIHGIGTVQVFGAVAGCSKLFGFDLEKTLNAFGIAGASAPVAHAGKFGWHDRTISSIKDNVAWPSEAGLRAAILADKGYHGSESILDGEQGFWVMAGSDRCEFSHLTDFEGYRILQVSHKPYPCCRWIHTTLDVIGEMMKDHGVDPGQVESIEVYGTRAMADYFADSNPETFIDAQFSIPIAVALKLHQIPNQDWFRVEAWNSPAVLKTAQKVNVHFSENLQSRFLQLERQNARIPAKVEMNLQNRSKHSGYSDLAWGSPEKPMSRIDLIAKYKNMTKGILNDDQQEGLISMIEDLDKLPDISLSSALVDKKS